MVCYRNVNGSITLKKQLYNVKIKFKVDLNIDLINTDKLLKED